MGAVRCRVQAPVQGAAMARIVCAHRSMAAFARAIAAARCPPDGRGCGMRDASRPASRRDPGCEAGGRFMQAVLGSKAGGGVRGIAAAVAGRVMTRWLGIASEMMMTPYSD